MVAAARTLQGFAVAMVVVISPTRSELAPIATTSLWISAALCGMALIAAIQKTAVACVGLRILLQFRSCCVAGGLFLLWGNQGSEADLAAAALIGAGVGTEWSPMTDCFRRLLSSQHRWPGVRFLSLTFPVGILAGVAAAHVSSGAAAVGAILSLLSVPAWFLLGPKSATAEVTEPQDKPASASSSKTPPAVVMATEVAVSGTLDENSAQTDCDAVKCCGGTRDFQPTPFQHGVVISVVGLFAVWGCTFDILQLALRHGAYAAAVAVAVGLTGGTWLLFSVAPRVGYIVVILPFLVLAGAATIACGHVPPTSAFFVATCLLCGMLAGGVACGTGAMIGELFSDCPDDAARSRVITVSLFASAVLMIVIGFLRPLLQSEETLVMLNSLMFVVGIFAVRAIPGPMISSLGRDDPSDAETEAEREDIVASLNS
ncbi:MAG: hypothetical protein ABGZ53_17740 [Fuerstiella sp.]